tara:strand:+ start:98 stop:310 length:213 start_codon:yes stop_codon:yes gene_type:complete
MTTEANWKELGNGIWPHGSGNDSLAWDAVVQLMDDDIREDVHARLAPCTKYAFLTAYLERDPQFGSGTGW